MLRRVLFALIACQIPDKVFVQVFSQFLFVIAVSAYLLAYQPFESELMLRFELLNEATFIILLYHVLSFGPWEKDPDNLGEDLSPWYVEEE